MPNKPLLFLSFLAVLSISSCCKLVTSPASPTSDFNASKNTDSSGYSSGTIIHSRVNSDCEWSIQLENGDFVETTLIDKKFLVDGKTIWFKYVPQRRMQRCQKAVPVAIKSIIERH